MTHYDVFNGDADGICALIQLRLAQPTEAVLITGVKRDIELLKQVSAQPDDQVTVLDISLAKNRPYVDKLLQQQADIFYVDHHQAGEIPNNTKLKALINTDANICTSLLINDYLQGHSQAWAIVGAFGDNLQESAANAALPFNWAAQQLEQIKNLGIYINYNSYGNCVADLHFVPDDLFKTLVNYTSPLDFISDNSLIYKQLLTGYADDINNAHQIKPEFCNDAVCVIILPDAAWARRISGVLGNNLASQYPGRAHAIVTINATDGYQISVRAPLLNKTGADELCSKFATGGGRKGAAGINHLTKHQLPDFIRAFIEKYN
jgi:hypothetical protein